MLNTMRTICKSSHPEVFLGKGVLKICNKFKGESPCRKAISIFRRLQTVWGSKVISLTVKL